MCAVITPILKNIIIEMNELKDNCIIPLKPCPLGQPPAIRAPIIAMTPPIIEKKARLVAEGPKFLLHKGGTDSSLKLLSNLEEI
jgi:hypothetical protein